MSFNPSETARIRVSEVERARFRYEVKLYLKAAAILVPIVALAGLAAWALMELF